MESVFGWDDVVKRANYDINFEVSSIDIQFFVGREGEAHVLAGRVSDFADHDVGRRFELERSGNQELRSWFVGVDVKAARHAKIESNRARFSLGDRGQRRRRHCHRRRL